MWFDCVATFENEEKEIKEHNRQIKQLQNEMTKINLLLSNQSHIQNKLEENNLELEQEFRSRLKASDFTLYFCCLVFYFIES